MPPNWTTEKLAELVPARLEVLRQNAIRGGDQLLAQRCETIQNARRQNVKPPRSNDPVIGFHFVCKGDYEITELPDGSFQSGVWAIDESHCGPAMNMKGYVALHTRKNEPSYRQGRIIGWQLEPRSKGAQQMGVTFLLEPTATRLQWYGQGSGEKGYRRVSDQPRWIPN